MKINELIKELRKFEREHGNLEVGICRINAEYKELAYYSDIVIFKVTTKTLFTDYNYETIDYNTDKFCELC